jgi:hypothetical protein
MPSTSPRQARFMAACAHHADYDSCPPDKVSSEFNRADAKTGILRKHTDGGLAAFAQGGGLASPHLQGGGFTGMSADTPWWTRAEARQDISMPRGGFVNSGVAGRTDRLPVSVAADSFIVPADVVSGIGQGNSLAGARMLSEAMRVGPWGISLPAHGHGPGPPRPPPVPSSVTRGLFGYDEGGRARKHASVLLAGGEMSVPPERVQAIGGGDMQEGHRKLREMVSRARKFAIQRQQALPPPKK